MGGLREDRFGRSGMWGGGEGMTVGGGGIETVSVTKRKGKKSLTGASLTPDS